MAVTILQRTKVAYYCSKEGYFGNHYYSSYALFKKLYQHIKLHKKSILFIDFGCGPATSGMAFIDSLKNQSELPSYIATSGMTSTDSLKITDINYVGVDIAPAMIEKAEEFLGIYVLKNKDF